MTILSIEEARHHLRVEPDYPQEQVTPYLEGAEELAQLYLNRRVYATPEALQAARQTVPGALQAAADTRRQAVEAAHAVQECAARSMVIVEAEEAYRRETDELRRILRGMVITPNIKTGILLTLGHLDENRETVARGISVTDLPKGAEYFLWPSRVGIGI